MIAHYLTHALRRLRSDRVATAIKLLALALGLTCFLSAHMIGDYFRRADSEWARASRTVAVAQRLGGSAGSQTPDAVGSAPSLAGLLREDFPELEAVARISTFPTEVSIPGRERTLEAYGADPELLDIFDLEMLAGEASLAAPRSALIEEHAARAAFGDESAIGRTLTLSSGVDVTVTGVFRELSPSSHLNALGGSGPDLLVPMNATPLGMGDVGVFFGNGGNVVSFGVNTYAVLPQSGALTVESFNARLDAFAERRVPPGQIELRFSAVPVGSITSIQFDRRAGSLFGLPIVTALYLLGALTLVVGCVNFANLSVAQAGSRAREIGMRRIAGASRLAIALQMLVESGLLTVGALVLVLPFIGILGRIVATQFGIDLVPPDATRIDYWASVLALTAGIAIVSGVYPALVLAGLPPAATLRASGLRGGVRLVRLLLIGTQFATAAFLLVLVAVMLAQKSDLRRSVASPDQDPVIAAAVPGGISLDPGGAPPNETLRELLLESSAITGVTFGDAPFGVAGQAFDEMEGLPLELAHSPEPGAERILAQLGQVYYDYFATNGSRVLAGRTFSRDRNDESAVVIDAETAMLLGYAPEEAVGRHVYQIMPWSSSPVEKTIIGVVDGDPWHLRTDGATNFMYVHESWTPVMMVRLSKDDVDGALAHLRNTWQRVFPGIPFGGTFVDEAFEQRYRSFGMINFAFMALSGMAVAIAAMGLYGMAAFIVQRRVREVGVRKTLGASTARVMRLLLWDFSKPVVAANLIAWPVAYLASQAYLSMFVNRIALTPMPFLISLAATLGVAGAAVAGHAWRAARVRPAHVLHFE